MRAKMPKRVAYFFMFLVFENPSAMKKNMIGAVIFPIANIVKATGGNVPAILNAPTLYMLLAKWSENMAKIAIHFNAFADSLIILFSVIYSFILYQI